MAYAVPAWLLQRLQAGGQLGPIRAPAAQMGAYGTNALGPVGSAQLPVAAAGGQPALGAAPHYSELLAPYSQRALPAGTTANQTFAMGPAQPPGAPIEMPGIPTAGALPMPYSQTALPAGSNATRTFAMPAGGSQGPIEMGAGLDVPATPTSYTPPTPRIGTGSTGVGDVNWNAVGADLNNNLTGAAASDLGAAGGTGLGGRIAQMAGNTSARVGNFAEPLGLTKTGLLNEVKAPFAAIGEANGLGPSLGAGVKAVAGRAGQALMFDAVPNVAAQALVAATGTKNTPGGQAALHAGATVGKGAGIGAMVAGPPGAVVGALAGGLAELGGAVGELQSANSYDDNVDKFESMIKTLPAKQRIALSDYAYSLHQAANGDPDIANKGLMQVAGIAQKVQQGKLKVAIDPSNGSLVNKASLDQANAAGGGGIGPNTQRRLQIQAAAARMMAPLANDIRQQGQAFGASIGAIPGVPPALAQYDAAQRQQYGNQTADAVMGSAYAQPLINDINSQIQQQQNLMAQINAARTAASGSGSSTDFAAIAKQLGLSKKKP